MNDGSMQQSLSYMAFISLANLQRNEGRELFKVKPVWVAKLSRCVALSHGNQWALEMINFGSQ